VFLTTIPLHPSDRPRLIPASEFSLPHSHHLSGTDHSSIQRYPLALDRDQGAGGHPEPHSTIRSAVQLDIEGSSPSQLIRLVNMSVPGLAPLERPHSDGPRVRSKRPAPPRALDALLSPDDSDLEDSFFVPTYLNKSVYMQRLESDHISKVRAQNAARLAKGNGQSAAGALSEAPSLPSGSHRGLSHQLVERHSNHAPDEGAGTLTPLPTRWNKEDLWGGIEIEPHNVVRHRPHQGYHERERDHEASAVRANHYVPRQCGIYYYEVVILDARRDDATIAIGFCTKTATLSRPIGWEPESYAYHGDDGRAFSAQNVGRMYSNPYNKGDVIGAGINFKTNTVFFTRNGKHLGDAFYDVCQGKMFPAISLKKPTEKVKANFGQEPFVFDIVQMMMDERLKIECEIAATDTSKLEPEMSESDLIQTLVLQFLQHDGYVDTAKAFAEEVNQGKQAMRQSLDPALEDMTAHDNEDAGNRQRIRKAILDGDIATAIKATHDAYPKVLKTNKLVHFKLRCRYFIELVRKTDELRQAIESQTKRNGVSADSNSQGMEIDQNGNAGGGSSSAEVLALETEMLEYGQTLQADYSDSTVASGSSGVLDELFSLMAYQHPLQEPQLQHLLDQDGRVVVAEELNVAILSSLGKSQRAALEKIYGQTAVLLDELRKEGGEGAFISVDDYVDEIPANGAI